MNAALHNHSINADRNPVGTVVPAAFYYGYWFSRSRA
jgi:hypothetical protein